MNEGRLPQGLRWAWSAAAHEGVRAVRRFESSLNRAAGPSSKETTTTSFPRSPPRARAFSRSKVAAMSKVVRRRPDSFFKLRRTRRGVSIGASSLSPGPARTTAIGSRLRHVSVLDGTGGGEGAPSSRVEGRGVPRRVLVRRHSRSWARSHETACGESAAGAATTSSLPQPARKRAGALPPLSVGSSGLVTMRRGYGTEGYGMLKGIVSSVPEPG